MVALTEGTDRQRHESTSRRLHSVSVEEIVEAMASRHGEDASQYATFRGSAAGRDMAAWLCRRWTGATLSQLGPTFGLTGTDSGLLNTTQRRHDGIEEVQQQEHAILIVVQFSIVGSVALAALVMQSLQQRRK